jgi:DNA-binding response OmpR family regulator
VSAPLAPAALKACVVVVDRDDAVRALLADAFAHLGVQTIGCESAAQAQRDLQTLGEDTRVVLVLWELETPDRAAYGAIRALQVILPGVPVLAMRSFPTDHDVSATRAHGIEDVIAKPLELDDLLARVTGLLVPAAG